MNSKRWQDQFQDEFQALEKSAPSLPGGRTLLAYALENQVVPEGVYLLWAQEQFQLPLLKSAYFENNPANTDLWNRTKDQFAWSEECLPLAEWDGILYVACLEPHDFPETLSVIPILCGTAGLKSTWFFYNNIEQEVAPEIILFGAAPVMNSQPPLELQDTPEAEVEIDNDSVLESELAKDAFVEDPNPVGLPTELSKANLNPLEELLTQTNTKVTLEKTVIGPTPPESPLVSLTTPPPAPPAEPPPAVAAEIKVNPLVATTPGSEALPALPEQPATPGASPKIPSVAVAHVKSPDSAASQRKETYFLEMIQKDRPQIFLKDCAELFTEMKKSFSKSLLISTDSKGNFARPIAWDENFAENKDSKSVELKMPSIFRIVDSTQKPFHGPISLNETNEAFLESWNHGAIPGHITLVPLINNDRVIGMIMGFAEHNAYNRTTLQAAEALAKDFLVKIFPGRAKAA